MGVACGTGFVALAVLMAGLIVAVNIGIRPLVGLIDQARQAGAEAERASRVIATCTAWSEATLAMRRLQSR